MAEIVGLAALLFGAGAVLRSDTAPSTANYTSSDAVARNNVQTITRALPGAPEMSRVVDPGDVQNNPDQGAQRMFPADSFGEVSFKDFIKGAGGENSAPDLPQAVQLEKLPPNVQPFFRGEKTQGNNPRIAQMKTELFSGVTEAWESKTGVYKNKAEGKSRFSPTDTAARVTFGGSAGNPQQDTEKIKESFVISGTMDKTLPFTQVRVGPGLGAGDGVAASGGFHDFTRVMPGNTGDYKKNQLPGGIVPGRGQIDASESRAFAYAKKLPPKFWTAERRPTAASGDPHAGLAGPMESAYQPQTDFITRDNVHPGDLRCPEPCGYGYASLNATCATTRGGAAGVGADGYGDPGDRSTNNRTLTPGGGQGTQPGPAWGGIPGAAIGVERFTVEDGRFEKLHREGAKTFSDYTNYGSSGASAVPMGRSLIQVHAPETTLRDITTVRPYTVGPVTPGDRGGAHAAPTVQRTNRQLLKHAKRGDQVTGYVPGPSMTRPDNLTYGQVGVKRKEIGGRIQGTALIQGGGRQPGVNEAQRGDDSRYGRKSGPINPRVWNDLAATQLKTNNWNHTLAAL